MYKLVSMGLPPKYPKPSATSSVMNERSYGSVMHGDADELMKVVMQPHKEVDHPVSNDPFAVQLREATNGTTGINLGTTSLKTPALESIQGIKENENSSPSFGENYSCADNGIAAILGPKLKTDENLYQHKWYPKPSATSSIVNKRSYGSVMHGDADELMKVVMPPHKEAGHPVSNDPFAVQLREATNGTTGIKLGTTSLKTPALESIQGIKENENSSPSFGENYSCADNGIAAILGPKLKVDENLYQHEWIRGVDPNMDSKKLKRTLANRLSAQKARIRQLEYISKLEERINNLKGFVISLTSQVSEKHSKHNELSNENDAMRDKIARLSNEHEIKYAQSKWLEQEIYRLWAIFQQQQQQEVQQTYYPQLQEQQLLLPPEQIQQQHEVQQTYNPQLQNQQLLLPPKQIQQQQLQMAECELGQEQVFNTNNPILVECELGQDQLSRNNYPNLAECEPGQDELFNPDCLLNLDEQQVNIPMDQLLNP